MNGNRVDRKLGLYGDVLNWFHILLRFIHTWQPLTIKMGFPIKQIRLNYHSTIYQKITPSNLFF